MLETVKMKARKESEIVDLEDRLRDAQLDLENHEHSLAELDEKIVFEKASLERLTKFNDIAAHVATCFPFVKTELHSFVHDEKEFGQNLAGFALVAVIETVAHPLFPASERAGIRAQVADLL
jgi:hypothetical protein